MPLLIKWGVEMGSNTSHSKSSSGRGLEPATHCQVSEPMWYAPGPLGQWAPQEVHNYFMLVYLAYRNFPHNPALPIYLC